MSEDKAATYLGQIAEMSLRLSIIAAEPERWEDYRATPSDTRNIIIDRSENNLSRCASLIWDELTARRLEVEALKAALQRIERATQSFDEGTRTTSRYPLTLQIHDIASAALKGSQP